MKKILIVLSLFLIFLFNLHLAFAQEEVGQSENSSSTESASVEYALPYPGLLPDNPFYVFKVARDAIVRFLISDPYKKAEFDLLQADKRLNIGYYLLLKNSGKDKTVFSTISKGENYFENAIKEISEAKSQGADINSLLERMILSSQKHQEVLAEIKSKISPQTREGIEKELKRVQNFEKLVSEIKPK
jgi:hypothetical protein